MHLAGYPVKGGAWLRRFDDVPESLKPIFCIQQWEVNGSKNKKSILKFYTFWLSEFHNDSGTKNRFQQLWMYKNFKHRKLPCIPCLGEAHIKLQWYNIFPSLFFLFSFAMQLFPTPVASPILHNQAPLFTAFTGHPLDAVIIAPTDFSEIGLLYEVGDCSRRKAKMLEVCHFIHDCWCVLSKKTKQIHVIRG